MTTALARRPHTATWTVLGRRLGVTSNHAKRSEILTAARVMTWVDAHGGPEFTHPAVRGVVSVIFSGHRRELSSVAVTALTGGRELIGVESADGTRSYIVVGGSEAVLVLINAAATDARVA